MPLPNDAVTAEVPAAFLLMCAERQMTAQVLGTLPPTQVSQTEFWAPGFRLIQPLSLQSFGE